METEKDIQNLAQLKSSQINRALGVFILFFGIIIIFATFFTDTFIAEMTNLVAGIILSLIGGGMIVKANSAIKKINFGK